VRRIAAVLGLVLAALAAAGCGGSAGAGSSSVQATPTTPPGETAPPPVRRPRRPVRIAALGDSITAGSPLWDPDPRVRAQTPDQLNDQSQYEYWAARRLGVNARFANCGVYGERTDQIARRLERCARGAQVLIVQGGINDIAQGRSIRAAADDLRAMVRRGRALGRSVVVTDVLPWNNGGTRAAAQIDGLNARIRRIAHEEHVPVLPFHDTLADPARPGRMRADWTTDGDHPNVTGYRRLGEVVTLP
jgi:lysophospholipase L1-like esterase